MANERTYPILPCRELDEAISFYETLGFKLTEDESAAVAEEFTHLTELVHQE